MNRDNMKPTASQVDTAMLITGEEIHNLEAVCAGLVDATDKLQAKDKGYLALGNADNIGWHAAPTLLELCAGEFGLEGMRASLMAAYRSGDAYGRNTLLAHWLYFVYQGAIPLLQKKYQIATALGKHYAAAKLGEAFAALPPRNKINHPNGWADIESEAKHLADEITANGFYDKICKAFRLDAEGTEKINEGEPDLLKDIAPDKSKTDAIKYCARLVCHIWNTRKHGGKRKSTDYVFVKAAKGGNLFDECCRARGLANKWGISTSTIQTQAARLHATQSGTKHKKCDAMERPETMRQAAKKSLAVERRNLQNGKRRA